jgi:hypothetical protein
MKCWVKKNFVLIILNTKINTQKYSVSKLYKILHTDNTDIVNQITMYPVCIESNISA